MGPFEAITAICTVITKGMDLVEKLMDGQPPEVRTELWKMYLEDVRAVRVFWAPVLAKLVSVREDGK